MTGEEICPKAGLAWELWRQDDNGNRYLVDRYERKSAAEARLAELSRSPHKQTYWISPVAR